jgi:hydrogenase maturation protein HypF
MLDGMLARGLNSPLSSSCGRLFDAVAAALGVCREAVSYEGQAAIELEALALRAPDGVPGYEFALLPGEPWQLDPAPLWPQLLDDLAAGLPPAVMAARFHRGLAGAVAGLTLTLARDRGIETVALSGGVFQNRLLLEDVVARLQTGGVRALLPRQFPANDGGLSLGQAVVATARALAAPQSI